MTKNAAPNTDDKRRAANRRNSQRSTGPATEQGKRASAQNALKYGFFSPRALLPGESAEAFEEFHAALMAEFGPRNPLEAHIIAQYIPLAWRLRRLPEIEAFAFNRYGISVQGHQCGAGFALVASVQTDNILGQLARYEATLRKSAFKYLDLFRSLRQDGWEQAAATEIEAEMIERTPAESSSPNPEADRVASASPALPPDGPASIKPESVGGADDAPAVDSSESDFFGTKPNSGPQSETTEDKTNGQFNEH